MLPLLCSLDLIFVIKGKEVDFYNIRCKIKYINLLLIIFSAVMVKINKKDIIIFVTISPFVTTKAMF
jgi:hypothetical protein